MVVVVVVGGLYFSSRPLASAVDNWFQVSPTKGAWYTWLVNLRYPIVVIAASVVLAAFTVRRDRPRAVTCLVAPSLALLAGELVVKPMVDRTIGNAPSYPSGSTVAAAALAAVAVLATPARWRAITVVAASAYALWMTFAVIALQWHYPTDALAGLVFGVGVVLVIDSATLGIDRRLVEMRSRRRAPPIGS